LKINFMNCSADSFN